MHPFAYIMIALALLLITLLVFARVGKGYRENGHLTRVVSLLQVGYFCTYAICSYVFLDSRIAGIDISSNVTRRVDYALFMVAALENDELVHEASAIVGCQIPSALAFKAGGQSPQRNNHGNKDCHKTTPDR